METLIIWKGIFKSFDEPINDEANHSTNNDHTNPQHEVRGHINHGHTRYIKHKIPP
jgi:hypothetical protein